MKLSLSLTLLLALTQLALSAAASANTQHYHDVDGDGVEEHDPEYDREKFLGKEEAKQFHGLTEAESKSRLEKLIKEEVDEDKDGFVTKEELEKHLAKVSNRQVQNDLDEQWRDLNLTDSEKLTWETHARVLNPGVFEDNSSGVKEVAEKAVEQSKDGYDKIKVEVPEKIPEEERLMLNEYLADLRKHRRRWSVADSDSDGLLSKSEYGLVLFPEELPAMRRLLTVETLEGLDADGDGRLSVDEIIKDAWKPKEGEQEPDWVKDERREFAEKRDLNGDGFMDEKEVEKWLGETEGGRNSQQEAEHLLQHADSDKDGRLSLQEILDSHELFAGSQATSFGDDLRERDEL